jgi:hypothetical protein
MSGSGGMCESQCVIRGGGSGERGTFDVIWGGREQFSVVMWGLVFEEAASSLVLPLRLTVAHMTGWYTRPL